ncbi:MAG: hypothetical protein GXO14_03175 [Thermococci archaeon]|nr:hypothetical protein [Thermococci archaeon]
MKAGEMSELEFCVKNLSYPLGMLLEGMEIRKSREDAKEVRVEGRTVEVPDVPFITECYPIARALFESLTEGDREKLKEDAVRA